MNSVHVSTESQQIHGTPLALVREIEASWGVSFVLDLAANEENAKCDDFIGLPVDSLTVNWFEAIKLHRPFDDSRPCAFLNPPFRGVEPWMEKCKKESAKGCRIISLTLASLGTGWYRDHVEGNALSLVLRRRVTFEGQKDAFPKELMISLWGFGLSGFGFWTPPASAVKSDAPKKAEPIDEELWPLESESIEKELT